MFPFTRKKNENNLPTEISENVAKKGIKTLDTVVTGMILGGIVASLYGIKKIREKNNTTSEIEDHNNDK